MKKLGFALIIFLVAFAIPVIVYTVVTDDSLDTRDEAADSAEPDANRVEPEFMSVPVTEAAVDSNYSYKVHVIDDDGDELELRVRQKPDWLEWDSDQSILSGTPSGEDVGTHRVEISATDGKWIRTQTFDVVVDDGTSQASESAQDVNASFENTVNEGAGDSGSEEVADAASEGGNTGVPNSQLSETDETGNDSDADYGLLPVNESTEVVASNQSVLGAGSTLPKTALSRWVIVFGVGCGAISMALFLWADARWSIIGQVSSSLQYRRGKQIAMDMGEGVTVTKRKVEV